MRRYLPIVPLLAMSAIVGVFLSVEGPPPTASRSSVASIDHQMSELIVAAPIVHKNLAIFPISSKTAKTDDLYITLDDGLASGTVEIYEVGSDGNRIEQPNASNAAANQPAGQQANQSAASDPGAETAQQNRVNESAAEVNRLMLVNRSGKALYLMPGEVIVGGSQDRTIANEHILASSDKPVSIDVFCVEHGRWGGREGEAGEAVIARFSNPSFDPIAFGENVARGARELAAKANEGKFVVSAGSLNKDARLAVQDTGEQTIVWQEVEKTVKKVTEYDNTLSLVVESGSFTANFASEDVAKRLESYLKQLHAPVADRDNVVGVVVAINGKVEAVDVFESSPLFRKLWPKLLKSYALDASGAADEDAESSEPVASVRDAREFLKKSLFANVAKSETTPGGLTVTRRAADGCISFSAERANGWGGGGFTGGGAGGAVHTSGFAAP